MAHETSLVYTKNVPEWPRDRRLRLLDHRGGLLAGRAPGLLVTLVTFSTPKLPSRLMKMGRGLFARADLAMPNGGQPEVQHRLRTLSQRREELSAVPARLETNLQGHLLSSLAKSIRG